MAPRPFLVDRQRLVMTAREACRVEHLRVSAFQKRLPVSDAGGEMLAKDFNLFAARDFLSKRSNG